MIDTDDDTVPGLRRMIGEHQAEIVRVRLLVGIAYREGHRAGYVRGLDRVDRPDADADWSASRASTLLYRSA